MIAGHEMTPRSSMWLTLANIAGLLVAAPLMPLCSRVFENAYLSTFNHFDVALPAFTTWMYGVGWYWWLAGAAAISAALLVAEWTVADKQRMFAVNLAVAVLVGVYLTMWIVADVMPLPELIRLADAVAD